MVILKIIGVTVASFLIFFIGDRIWRFADNMWVRRKYPDYDRDLSQSEVYYIKNAQKRLISYAETTKFPHIYWVYQMIFIPLMLIGFGGGFVAWMYIDKIITSVIVKQIGGQNYLYSTVSGVGVSLVIGIFFMIMLAGWLCYFLFSKHRDFQNYLVLTVPANHGEAEVVTLRRRLAHIEHDVRLGRLDVLSEFSVPRFLGSIYRRHQKYVGNIAFMVAIPMLMFSVFDLQYRQIFTKDNVQYSPYWSFNKKIIRYEDLTHVEIECKITRKGRRDVSLIFYDAANSLASIHDPHLETRAHFGKVLQLDAILREKNIDFKIHYWTPPNQKRIPAYSQKCINAISLSIDKIQRDDFYHLMHGAELSMG